MAFNNAVKSLMRLTVNNGSRLLDEVYAGHSNYLHAHRLLTIIADDPQRPPGWPISEILWNYLDKTLQGTDRLNVGLTAFARRDYLPASRLLAVIDPASIPTEIMLAASGKLFGMLGMLWRPVAGLQRLWTPATRIWPRRPCAPLAILRGCRPP